MALKKIAFKPGVNRENTRYTTEGGWYDCDKIRFRQGTPEKIGGWQFYSEYTYLGVCRSLWAWTTLGSVGLLGVGTNLKFYIERGGQYYDITPIRATETLTNPFDTTSGSPIVEVTDAAGGFVDGDFVTFSGATAVGGLTLNGEYQITYIDATTYTINAGTNASSTATGGGTVTAAYQINVGPAISVPITGWGGGTWGLGTWGFGSNSASGIRLWSQGNFGEDLIFNPRGGGVYYWDATGDVTTRAFDISGLSGAVDTPVVSNFTLVSDINRFVFCMGTNEAGSTTLDPMLIRWSDQENAGDWEPRATNQAGSLRLSRGSEIITALQARQEVLVWTDVSLYSLQYVGAPIVWTAQLVGETTSLVSPNAVAYANGAAYWMGRDKFYKYDGRLQTLRCDLKQFIFQNINEDQIEQVFAGTNERFDEVWWFYCENGSMTINRYVVYNYVEDVWYYGTIARTAWLDAGVEEFPVAASYYNNLIQHEIGTDDVSTPSILQPINAYITSAEFDLEDGDRFMFIWRVLPDITFRGSTVNGPKATMTLLPLQSSGSGYNNPASVGGTNTRNITRTAVLPIEEFTGIVYTRVRGRQLSIKVESSDLGVAWQLGSPRIDARPDGKR